MEQQQVATPQDATPAPSIDDKIAAKFGLNEPESQPEQPEATPATEQPVGEEDVVIPDEEVPQPSDWAPVEITHNGQKKAIASKDEAVRLMQMGTDYDFKMGRLREDTQRLQGMAQAVQAQAAISPQYLDALADVRAYDKQLTQYANVDWAAEASGQDPIGAWQRRMHFDQLRDARQAAAQRAQQLHGQLSQAQQHIDANQVQLESQKLLERFPEWKDSAKYAADSRAIAESAMKSYGFTPQELQSSPLLYDSRVVALLRDAWKYREAVNTKGKKGVPQGLPQVAKPGAPQPPRPKSQQIGDVKRALHQPNLSRENRKALEDELVARKFGLK